MTNSAEKHYELVPNEKAPRPKPLPGRRRRLIETCECAGLTPFQMPHHLRLDFLATGCAVGFLFGHGCRFLHYSPNAATTVRKLIRPASMFSTMSSPIPAAGSPCRGEAFRGKH